MGLKLGIQRVFECLATPAECSVIDECCWNACFARVGKARRFRPVRYDQHDLGWIVPRPGRLDQRRHVRSAAGDEHGNALLGHARHQERSRCPRKPTRPLPLAATISPSRATVSPLAVRSALAASDALRSRTATIPMPQLKVRNISASPILPLEASHLNTGRTGTRPRSNETARPCGSTRGIFSTKPPPVIWASALTAPV